jgi:serine phosphatase RsbU (regulator of sigma subunit)
MTASSGGWARAVKGRPQDDERVRQLARRDRLSPDASDSALLRLLFRPAGGDPEHGPQQKEHATRIQRDLLPSSAPRIEGYDLAGSCLPAQDMAGDFFDWVLRDDGQLDLMVADVMGKGIAAALVMAALRTGLRAVAPEAGPAERVRVAARSLGLATDDGLFVTLFQARLDLATGVLRYVDAGHC